VRTATTAEQNINRVGRFLSNEAVATGVLACALSHALAPAQDGVEVLADWTDVANPKLLVFALSGNVTPCFFLDQSASQDRWQGRMDTRRKTRVARNWSKSVTTTETILLSSPGAGSAIGGGRGL